MTARCDASEAAMRDSSGVSFASSVVARAEAFTVSTGVPSAADVSVSPVPAMGCGEGEAVGTTRVSGSFNVSSMLAAALANAFGEAACSTLGIAEIAAPFQSIAR
jgi:hypothetical protein